MLRRHVQRAVVLASAAAMAVPAEWSVPAQAANGATASPGGVFAGAYWLNVGGPLVLGGPVIQIRAIIGIDTGNAVITYP
jgi:hypothetical protein